MTEMNVASSLLEDVVVCPVHANFNIGMDEWLEPKMLGPVYRAAKQPLPDSAAKQPLPDSDSAKQPRNSDSAKQPRPNSAAKRPHTAACPPGPTKKSRFASVNEKELDELAKPNIPANTKNSTKWAIDNFNLWRVNLWRVNKNTQTGGDKCPESLLDEMDPVQLNRWLSVYVAETMQKGKWSTLQQPSISSWQESTGI